MATYSCAWPSGMAYIPASSPCGPINETNPVVPCCANGDYCLSDNICAYTSHSNVGGSGYYSAGCSNGTIMDNGSSSACSNRCADTGLPDIVYDSSDGSWKCCGGTESERNCQAPTNETFIGAAPSNLYTIWIAGSSTTMVSTSTSTSTSTTSKTASTSISTSTTSTTSTTSIYSASTSTTSTPSATETQVAKINHSPELSAAAKTGIGISAGVVGFALLALVSLYFRRRHHRQAAVQNLDMPPTNTPKTLYELPPTAKIQELPPDTRPLAELY